MPKREEALRAEDVIGPEIVIHPALDWVDGQLIVGVRLKDGRQGVLSSASGLVSPDQFGPVCAKGIVSSSIVTQEIVKAFCSSTPEVSNGKGLLNRIGKYLKRFVAFPKPEWAEILALWILGTYLYPMFQTYPYVWITSASPGCGKSLLGQIVAALGFNGEFMVSPNETHLFRLAESTRGVQVWDETELVAETEKRRFEAVKPVLLKRTKDQEVEHYRGAIEKLKQAQDVEEPIRAALHLDQDIQGTTGSPDLARTIFEKIDTSEGVIADVTSIGTTSENGKAHQLKRSN
jgi:hypothetical protein